MAEGFTGQEAMLQRVTYADRLYSEFQKPPGHPGFVKPRKYALQAGFAPHGLGRLRRHRVGRRLLRRGLPMAAPIAWGSRCSWGRFPFSSAWGYPLMLFRLATSAGCPGERCSTRRPIRRSPKLGGSRMAMWPQATSLQATHGCPHRSRRWLLLGPGLVTLGGDDLGRGPAERR
jgi:hypothetical protein